MDRREFVLAMCAEPTARHGRDERGAERIFGGVEQFAAIEPEPKAHAILADIGLLEIEPQAVGKADQPNPQTGIASVRYDRAGRTVAVFVDGLVPPGKYSVVFDASAHASGVYIAVLETATQVLTRLMVVMK